MRGSVPVFMVVCTYYESYCTLLLGVVCCHIYVGFLLFI